MDLIDEIKNLASKISKQKENVPTEEATKTAFVMPFIRSLGYDVFSPSEVVPEFTADVGTKKNEKVDYAIKKDDKIILLIECKSMFRRSPTRACQSIAALFFRYGGEIRFTDQWHPLRILLGYR